MRSSKASIGSLSSMANKVRQEKKNSAAAKAKAPLARAREANKPFKSADKVADSSSNSDSDSSASSGDGSDSDDDLNAARAKFLASKAAKQTKAADAKPMANGVKPTATPAKPFSKGSIPTSAQKPASQSDSASESGSESDGSSSDGSPSKSPANKAKSKSKSKSSSDSTSSSGSSSDSEEAGTQKKAANVSSDESDSASDDEDVPNAAARAPEKAPVKNAVSAARESSSDESDSDGDDGGDRMAVDKTNESASQLSRAQWLNNADFMLRKASSANPGKEVADFFSKANLDGKQVWYFTAPASLPITVLKDMEIDLSKATKGEALLNHNGDDYGLDLEPYATSTQIQLLIPSREGDKYASLNHGIDSTVHLRRMAKFGPGGEVHATATDDYVPVPKPIREQPEGLKVRYTPIGVPTPVLPIAVPTRKATGNGDASSSQGKTKASQQPSSGSESESESESDVEMTTPSASAVPASQTKPVKPNLTNGDRKRKHAGEEDQAAKRQKAEKGAEAPSVKKQSLVQTPDSSATPSKKPSAKTKDRKEKVKKDKTPKSAVMTPTSSKQTPVPLPSYPGMKR
ncbi:DNA-directed RNA polymerase I subunit RPA34.5-domain-containing protein [Xylaria venustula]|nr:DNA-directed RNA polymerase I subunit RPA34.5-domain-containing protein [Xylaria venustula]